MCTLQKRNNIFLLTLTGPTDHRLNPTLISSIRSLLAEAKSQATPGSVLVTVGEGRFFSNGFDLAWANKNGRIVNACNGRKLIASPSHRIGNLYRMSRRFSDADQVVLFRRSMPMLADPHTEYVATREIA